VWPSIPLKTGTGVPAITVSTKITKQQELMDRPRLTSALARLPESPPGWATGHPRHIAALAHRPGEATLDLQPHDAGAPANAADDPGTGAAPDGADPAFSDRVRPGVQRIGVRITRAPYEANTPSNTRVKLRVAVPDEAFRNCLQHRPLRRGARPEPTRLRMSRTVPGGTRTPTPARSSLIRT
jgi:hypothetical protein